MILAYKLPKSRTFTANTPTQNFESLKNEAILASFNLIPIYSTDKHKDEQDFPNSV